MENLTIEQLEELLKMYRFVPEVIDSETQERIDGLYQSLLAVQGE